MPMKKSQERKKAKCPRCGAEYDMLDEAAIKAMGGLCAACWHDRHERDIGEDREREAGRREKTTS
jgi:NMD protein affecting ribosome stability and mRNA decay